MPITAAQTTAFFTHPDQMAIPAATIESLGNEGIETVDDLAEVDKDMVVAMAKQFRQEQPPVILGAKSSKRLIVACNAVRYYSAIQRSLTAGMMRWDPTLKYFEAQWEALITLKDKDRSETPRINKALPVLKWAEVFRNFLYTIIGSRNVPLAYIIRTEANVENAADQLPALQYGKPHSEDAGSIIIELINSASHTHPNFSIDNGEVFDLVEQAARNTQYMGSIQPFKRRRDGRSAYNAIVSQHAGKDKWEAELKKAQTVMQSTKYKGSGNFTLDRYTTVHRNANERMKEAAQHVTFQLPEEHTRVTHLLDNIDTSDARLNAAIATIHQDDALRSDFEGTVATIVPQCPVARRNKKRASGQISATDAQPDDSTNTDNAFTISSVHMKKGIGKSGVHFRFYPPEEYKTLTAEQRKELHFWRLTPEGKAATAASKASKGNKNKKTKMSSVNAGVNSDVNISSLVEKAVNERLKAIAADKSQEDEANAIIEAAVSKAVANMADNKPSPSTKATQFDKSALIGILKRAKNGKKD